MQVRERVKWEVAHQVNQVPKNPVQANAKVEKDAANQRNVLNSNEDICETFVEHFPMYGSEKCVQRE